MLQLRLHNKISSTDSKSWNCVHLCLHDWCWKFKGQWVVFWFCFFRWKVIADYVNMHSKTGTERDSKHVIKKVKNLKKLGLCLACALHVPCRFQLGSSQASLLLVLTEWRIRENTGNEVGQVHASVCRATVNRQLVLRAKSNPNKQTNESDHVGGSKDQRASI